MRVLLISTSYPRDASDWRGIFMRYLVDALATAEDVQLAVWAPPGQLCASARSATTTAESAWLARLMMAGGISHLIRSGGLSAAMSPIRLMTMLRAAYRRNTNTDVYHINWLQCAIPLPFDAKPALITVLGNDLKLLRLPLVRAALRRVMKSRNVAICPNAEWMVGPLHDAFGDIAQIIPISFGIDQRWYAIERQLYDNVPKRWLAVTRLTADKLGPLFEWSAPIFDNVNRELHLFGPMQEGIDLPPWIHYHGPATPEELAENWFPSAYGLITLSRHAEGRPQVMLEAMAAGLPIIASGTAAHASLVEEGHTGSLCNSTDSYHAAIHLFENTASNKRAGEEARAWVRREMGTWTDCANRYTSIYRKLLGNAVNE